MSRPTHYKRIPAYCRLPTRRPIIGPCVECSRVGQLNRAELCQTCGSFEASQDEVGSLFDVRGADEADEDDD